MVFEKTVIQLGTMIQTTTGNSYDATGNLNTTRAAGSAESELEVEAGSAMQFNNRVNETSYPQSSNIDTSKMNPRDDYFQKISLKHQPYNLKTTTYLYEPKSIGSMSLDDYLKRGNIIVSQDQKRIEHIIANSSAKERTIMWENKSTYGFVKTKRFLKGLPENVYTIIDYANHFVYRYCVFQNGVYYVKTWPKSYVKGIFTDVDKYIQIKKSTKNYDMLDKEFSKLKGIKGKKDLFNTVHYIDAELDIFYDEHGVFHDIYMNFKESGEESLVPFNQIKWDNKDLDGVDLTIPPEIKGIAKQIVDAKLAFEDEQTVKPQPTEAVPPTENI